MRSTRHLGERSIGIGRAHGYGAGFAEYLRERSYAIVAQVESATGVANIEEIAASDAVDAVLIGPYDLSGSYGVPGEVESELVQDGIARALACCRRHGKPCGIFAADETRARRAVAQGFGLVGVGMESTVLLQAWTGLRAAVGGDARGR
jgi:2-keto-3-deoxy-L-rhamnonate aldolase RhmA